MQFNIAFITAALLISATPALSVTFKFFDGANCDGKLLATSNGAAPGDCVFFAKAASSKSIHYAGIPGPDSVHFFKSGGKHDKCTNGAAVTRNDAAGCATAPAGSNFEGVRYNKAN